MRSHQITSTTTRLIWAGKSSTTLNACSLSHMRRTDSLACLVNFSCIFSCWMVIISVWQTARHHAMALIHSLWYNSANNFSIAAYCNRSMSNNKSQTVNANVVHLTRVHRREKRASHLERCCCCCISMLIRFPDLSGRWCSSSNHFSD